MSSESPVSPPLLVTPLESLSPSDRDKFDADALDLGKVGDGMVVSIPFPIAMYHRIDGIWIPVSDLGSFNAPHPASPSEQASLIVDHASADDDLGDD